MALGTDRLAALHADVSEPATEFRLTRELTGSLQGDSQDFLHGRSWDGSVIVCLEVDGEDRAVVEVQCASGPGYDDLATVEQAIAHLEAVRCHLLTMQGVQLRRPDASRDLVS